MCPLGNRLYSCSQRKTTFTSVCVCNGVSNLRGTFSKETLQDRVLSVTEFPEAHGRASCFAICLPTPGEWSHNGVTVEGNARHSQLRRRATSSRRYPVPRSVCPWRPSPLMDGLHEWMEAQFPMARHPRLSAGPMAKSVSAVAHRDVLGLARGPHFARGVCPFSREHAGELFRFLRWAGRMRWRFR
jgi:hypothetical protein